MSDKMLIRNCSPTLAGMKTGNLFSCPFESAEHMRKSLRRFNQRLGGKGIRLLPVRYRDRRALIYVYRPTHLARDLFDSATRDILHARGYRCDDPTGCVVQLIRRLRDCEDFPHEIGLFLGYPPEDVHGFIELGADACKFSGCWRVYGDETNARRLFAKYKKCTEVYSRRLDEGNTVEHLTVAG